MTALAERPKHHIWCNFVPMVVVDGKLQFDMYSGAETCEMCSGLKSNYPETGKSESDLMAEHFPNVVRVV